MEFANKNSLIQPIWARYRRRHQVAHTRFDNVYHCCTQKTASQWFRGIFADPIFSDHTGLQPHPFVDLGLDTVEEVGPFPKGTIVTHLYIGYDTYCGIDKPASHRTFFVMRDPRDAIVSWYFSALKSHARIGPIPKMRSDLAPLDQEEGLCYIVDKLADFGFYRVQRSWLDSAEDEHCRIFRYESLAADNRAFLKHLLEYLEVDIAEDKLSDLSDRYAFSRLSHGRDQGSEDVSSHYRKGVAGDWVNYFTPRVRDHYYRVTGDLTEALGYED